MYEDVTPLCKDARDELCMMYPEETAPQLARRYRTMESQVHASWAGRDPKKQADPDLVLLVWNECNGCIRDTAKVLDLAVATVRSALAKRDVIISTSSINRNNSQTVASRDECIMYDLEYTNLTHQEIADKYAVHRAYVSKLNPNKRHYNKVDKQGILNDLKCGYNVTQISKRRGVSRSAIYNLKGKQNES